MALSERGSIPQNGVRKIGMTIAQKTRGDTYVRTRQGDTPDRNLDAGRILVNKPVTKIEAFVSELEADGRIVSKGDLKRSYK